MATIAIIGAGPAGMFAALQAAAKHTVILIDLNDTPGRKLSSTGSGRGNLANRHAAPDSYPGKAQKFIQTVYNAFPLEDLLRTLEQLGIFTYATDDGWIYPASNSASNVSELIEAHLRAKKVQFWLNEKVTRLDYSKNTFILQFSSERPPLHADAVLVATGGKAAPQLGADMDILQSILRLGHNLLPVHPALAPIATETKPIQKILGVRMDLTLALYEGKARLGRATGNAIFAQWGVNGPAAMNLSHLIQPGGRHDYWLSIDFLPGQSKALRSLLQQYEQSEIPFLVLLKSVLPPKVARLAIDKCGIAAGASMNSLNRTIIEKCMEFLTAFRLPVLGTREFEFAQLSTGGVDINDVDPNTMMSRKIRNLFFAGEILNIYGPCGGYNLQWAFASGASAGRSMNSISIDGGKQ